MVANEPGILLMHKDLQKYVANAASIGSAAPSDSWLLDPDFCSGDERSQEVIDNKGQCFFHSIESQEVYENKEVIFVKPRGY